MLNESWKSLEKHFEEGITLGIGEVKAFWDSWLSMQLGNSMQDEEVELWENRNLGENNKKKSKQNKKKRVGGVFYIFIEALWLSSWLVGL